MILLLILFTSHPISSLLFPSEEAKMSNPLFNFRVLLAKDLNSSLQINHISRYLSNCSHKPLLEPTSSTIKTSKTTSFAGAVRLDSPKHETSELRHLSQSPPPWSVRGVEASAHRLASGTGMMHEGEQHSDPRPFGSLATHPNYPPISTPGPYLRYPPLGTLGPYGKEWFPKEYKRKLPNRDRSSTGTPGVEIVSIELPPLVKVGDNISLTCHYRFLGAGQKLYTLNWWRDQDQFFTYGQHDNKNSYDFSGITVDEGRSNDRSVRLLRVSEASSGSYKCEVMTEAPAFRTAVMYESMSVVVPPARVLLSPPEAAGLHTPGQRVELNCTAEAARPRPQLAWIVNGNPLIAVDTIQYTDEKNKGGRVTSKIGVQFIVPQHFHRGMATIACRVMMAGHQIAAPSVTLYLDTNASAAYNAQYSGAGPVASVLWVVLLLRLVPSFL